MVKRYLAEAGAEQVRNAMGADERWFVSRVAYTETLGALIRDVGEADASTQAFKDEWALFDIIDLTQEVVARAADLVGGAGLRSLDAVHLSSALIVPRGDMLFATWDRRLWRAARDRDLRLLPAEEP